MPNQKPNILLDKIAESNTEWVAQQLLLSLKPRHLSQLKCQVKKLEQLLYKSWAKEMPFSEILNAFKLIEENNR